jgi:hypothetical protein
MSNEISGQLSDETKVRVAHRTDADKFHMTTMDVKSLTPFDRVTSAFGALIFCWFIALVCVAIPVLHFFLVPLGLIAGVVAFFYKLQLHERRKQTEIKCPSCEKPLVIKAGSFNWPLKETCGECRSGLLITKTV